MSRREKLKKLREEIETNTSEVTEIKKATRKLVSISEISKDEYKDIISIYDDWKSGVSYEPNQIVKKDNELYEIIQPHTSQQDWLPESTPALYKNITAPETNDGVEIVPDYKQPLGAHDSYKKGDKVRFDSKIYESLIDNNVHSPSAHPAGWKEVK